jgi:hypothetical protein
MALFGYRRQTRNEVRCFALHDRLEGAPVRRAVIPHAVGDLAPPEETSFFGTILLGPRLHLLQAEGEDVEEEGRDEDDALERLFEVDADVRQEDESVGEDAEDHHAEDRDLDAALAAEA